MCYSAIRRELLGKNCGGMKKDLLQQILYPHCAESRMGRFEQVFI